jgi:hypothetical protein
MGIVDIGAVFDAKFIYFWGLNPLILKDLWERVP